MVTRLLILAALVASTGCEKRSTLYCEKNPEDLANCEQLDAPPPEPVACMNDTMCAGLFCELGAHRCVECLNNTQCDASERCDVGGSFTCRGCISDTDCPGGTCMPSGSCGGDDTVIYVQAGGNDGGTCTFAAPCATLAQAATEVTTTRKHVRINGAITESLILTDQSFEIFAGPMGATINGAADGTDWVLKLQTSQVRIIGVTIYCTGGSDQLGIKSEMASTTTLEAVDVSNCGREAGIVGKGGVMTITRSNIHDNSAGGIIGDGQAKLTITNNFIHHNGVIAGMHGGIDLGNDVTTERIEFNTIVSNMVGGIQCKTAFAVPNNIIGGNGLALTNNVTGCTADASFVSDNLASFAFVSETAPYDYHIKDMSLAKDTAMNPTTILEDVDGELRPQGMYNDFGADELKP